VLCCVVLCYSVLCCALLCCIALVYSVVLCCVALCSPCKMNTMVSTALENMQVASNFYGSRFPYCHLPFSSIRQLHLRSCAEIIRLVLSHYGDEGKSWWYLNRPSIKE
jgi:hypothetical protein